MDELDLDSEEEEAIIPRVHVVKTIFKYLRMGSLLLFWVFSISSFLFATDSKKMKRMIAVSETEPFEMDLVGDLLPHQDLYGVILRGPIIADSSPHGDKQKGELQIKFESSQGTGAEPKQHQNLVVVPIKTDTSDKGYEVFKRGFEIPDNTDELKLSISQKDAGGPVALEIELVPNMISSSKTIILGGILLLMLYMLIIWDIVDRVFAALLAATAAIAILSFLHERPSLETIVGWIDLPTMLLLFGMMIIVSILGETGIFDVVAVHAYRISRGHPWPMIYTICMITGVLSAFLDNVTMMLLMTPITIRLCEVMDLNVVNVLIVIVVFSNIGGAMTPVGDPPNVIISNNSFVKAAGVNFLVFTLHTFPCILVCLIVTLVQARFQLGNAGIMSHEDEHQRIARELQFWQHARNAVGSISAKEQEAALAMGEKIEALKEKYKAMKRQPFGLKPVPNFVDTLVQMQTKYPLKNKPLLIKAGIALAFAISMFCLQSLPAFKYMSIEWAALMAALLLLILANTEDLSGVLERIEWPTLLFFAALFVVMESLSEMGLIEWIGLQTVNLIGGVSDEARVAVAIILIVWISGIASAFIDNIPISQMMIKVCVHVHLNEKLNMPLTPMIWSLILGSCMGANGTLIGSSSNVVCAGIAAQHGYKFTFFEFFKIGFPLTITTLVISTLYLLICHAAGKWH